MSAWSIRELVQISADSIRVIPLHNYHAALCKEDFRVFLNSGVRIVVF